MEYHSNEPMKNGDAEIVFEKDCRDCGHHISKRLPLKTTGESSGIHIYCGDCGRSNWIPKGRPGRKSDASA